MKLPLSIHEQGFHDLSNIPEVNTPYPGGCSDKAPVDDLGGQSDGLEYLCSLVRLHGGDPHLGHHLGDAPVHCGGVVLVSLILALDGPGLFNNSNKSGLNQQKQGVILISAV